MSDTATFNDLDATTWVEVATNLSHASAQLQNQSNVPVSVHVGTVAPTDASPHHTLQPGQIETYSGFVGKVYVRAGSTYRGQLGRVVAVRS